MAFLLDSGSTCSSEATGLSQSLEQSSWQRQNMTEPGSSGADRGNWAWLPVFKPRRWYWFCFLLSFKGCFLFLFFSSEGRISLYRFHTSQSLMGPPWMRPLVLGLRLARLAAGGMAYVIWRILSLRLARLASGGVAHIIWRIPGLEGFFYCEPLTHFLSTLEHPSKHWGQAWFLSASQGCWIDKDKYT